MSTITDIYHALGRPRRCSGVRPSTNSGGLPAVCSIALWMLIISVTNAAISGQASGTGRCGGLARSECPNMEFLICVKDTVLCNQSDCLDTTVVKALSNVSLEHSRRSVMRGTSRFQVTPHIHCRRVDIRRQLTAVSPTPSNSGRCVARKPCRKPCPVPAAPTSTRGRPTSASTLARSR